MNSLEKIYGNRIRLRVCGILKDSDKVLLVNHKLLNSDNIFWNLPGGGLEKGESIVDCLIREFLEETNLNITVHELLFFNQFLENSLHALELYFSVTSENKTPKLGSDPELNILTDLRWFTKEEILNLEASHYSSFISEIAFK